MKTTTSTKSQSAKSLGKKNDQNLQEQPTHQNAVKQGSKKSKQTKPRFTEEFDLPEEVLTGEDLLAIKETDIPHLWFPYFPQVGVVCIAGPSDAGKSTFSRQLALAICNDDKDFIYGKLNPVHKSAIYVSTEEEKINFGIIVKKQVQTQYKENLKNFRLLLNVDKIIGSLNTQLSKQSADLVVIDVWSDFYRDNPNDFTKVRADINKYSRVARKFKTCICLIHHNTKGSAGKEPSKDNLNGSQGIEARVRTLLDIRDKSDSIKQITVTKGNYVKRADKKMRLLVTQGDDLNFVYEGIEEITRESKVAMKDDIRLISRAVELEEAGHTQDKIVQLLREEFPIITPSKGTVNTILKENRKKAPK